MDHTGRRQVILFCGFLAVLTLAAFWPVLHNGFVRYDDPDYVTQNPHVLGGLTWANLNWALTTGHAGNWHPLTWISHLLDVQFFGLRPFGHHLTSLLLHVANTVLVFLVLQRMSGAVWPSVAVAALFGLHPLRVESVAWVAERKDVLSGFFFLLTLWAYAGYAAQDKTRRLEPRSPLSGSTAAPPTSTGTRTWARTYYLLSLCFFALALLSKPMAVTLPFVLLLLDFWPLQRLRFAASGVPLCAIRPLLWEKVPFFAMSVGSSVVTVLIQGRHGAFELMQSLPFQQRVDNALVSYCRYLGKVVWPWDLAVFYPMPQHWPVALVVAATVVVCGISFWALRRWQISPYQTVGWFWYLGMLLPVIGVVQVGLQAMADRYTYLPSIGILVAVVWSAAEYVVRWPKLRLGFIAAGIVAVMGCSTLTWKQVGYWVDNLHLFEHTLEVTRNNYVAHNNLGVSLLEMGKKEAAKSHFEEAARIKPEYADALVNLGLCRVAEGQTQQAEALFRQAIGIKPTPLGHYNLARLLAESGNLDEAERNLRRTLELRPEMVEAWQNLGSLRLRRGDGQEAVQAFVRALELKPEDADIRLSLGAALAGQQNYDGAIAQFEALLLADPANVDAHFNLGAALNAKGDFSGATLHYTEACRLRPKDTQARQALGMLYLSRGQTGEAVAQFREVLNLRPDAGAHYQLALALHLEGRAEEALLHYREAVQLDPKAPLYLNDLAWFLATDPDPRVRDGTEAVRLAQDACRLSGGKEPRFWGTLDAALAEAGRMEEAVATARKTRELALAAGQAAVVQAAEERLACYQANHPFHESPRRAQE